MVAAGTVRAHGQTTAEEVANEQSKEILTPMQLEPEKPASLTRAFQRMRTDWHSADRDTIDSVKDIVDKQILETFADAFSIMYEIYDQVRIPIMNPKTGEFEIGPDGLTNWQRKSDGSYVEDWSKIGRHEREKYLYMIITRLFEWEQSAADIWGEALFAKAYWEEAFATGFDSITDAKATVDARTARANRLAADHRYLAVFKSLYSRRADAIVKSLDRLAIRLKDLHLA